MKMSPFSKPTIEPAERWLKNEKAAELLGFEARTIKRWMLDPARRKALGAVRYGKQWRIPLPKSFNGDSGGAWEMLTRYRLKEIGVVLKESWEIELEKLNTQCDRYLLESYRLWLAAHLHLSVNPSSDGIKKEDITAVLLMWQTACHILDSLPMGTEVDKLKSEFPAQLRARNFPEAKIRFVMSYWPEKEHFKRVRAAHTIGQLEKIRAGVDCTQAAKTCKNLGQKPTAENLRPFLHKDFITHLNDTRESVPVSTTDFRHPQNGLPLRTFRKRYPLKQSTLKAIITTLFCVRDSVPGIAENLHTGQARRHDPNMQKKV